MSNQHEIKIGAAITSDNYDAGEPDQLEMIDVLVRGWTNWRDSKTIFERTEANAVCNSEIRHIFGCGALEEADKKARLQKINHEALQLQYASKSVTSDVTIDLHVTGAEGLYIKRRSLEVKIPLNAVDSELLSAIDAMFPSAKWYGEDGGYAHAW